MIGWKPHESQPRPLKRGSATTSMTEIPKIASSSPPSQTSPSSTSTTTTTTTESKKLE